MTKRQTLLASAVLASTAAFLFPAQAFAQAANSRPIAPSNMNHRENTIDVNAGQWGQSRSFADTTQAREYASAMTAATCLTRRTKGSVSNLIGGEMTPDPKLSALSEALSKKYRNCLSGTTEQISINLVNAALAEQQIASMETALDDRALAIDLDKARSYYEQGGKIATLDGLSRCLAVYSPGLVQKFLKTQSGSESENSALAAVYNGSPQCGVATPPTIDTSEHRQMLATGLYNWLNRT